jgi:hypothetical protein|tara:strand:- start:894 stop:1109 length:216 start_codon:yes stop_codon:yes gene_type:complete
MGFRYDDDSGNGKWWELMLAWKWPHQGFTIGYDLVEPNDQPQENEMVYYTVLMYLGPLSIIYNFGNHDWNE